MSQSPGLSGMLKVYRWNKNHGVNAPILLFGLAVFLIEDEMDNTEMHIISAGKQTTNQKPSIT